MRIFRSVLLGTLVSCSLPAIVQAQAPERFDPEVMSKIKEEGTDRSKIMETISYLTDVHGPRLTGSPITKRAGEWTTAKLTEWGLENAHLEPWGPFGTGWTLEGFSANMIEPTYSSLIGYPKAWSPSTPQKVVGEPIYLKAEKPEDLDQYRGKLNKAIVLISPPREVKAWFDPPATRKTDQELLDLANADANARRRRGGGPGGPGGPGAGGAPGAGPGAQVNAVGAPGAPPANATPGGPNANPEIRRMMEQSRGSMQLQNDKWQMAYDEGAAVVIEPGRGDGGTVFVQSVTMPRRADTNRTQDNPFSRGPRPWATDETQILPQVVMSAEHYNRLVRMIEKGAHPKVEVDIASKFHKGDDSSFNVIAEIPGTDLKDEVVMLGAHFDSWHSGTGATDNAVGCGVALEAVRILKAIDAKPRRTIRVALWTGEEQGLLGSKAYVTDHFGKTVYEGFSGGFGEGRGGPLGDDGGRRRVRAKYELKPEHEKLSAYFNLDNGTGKIRGIHLQGNEALRPMFRQWFAQFADMGASTITHANTGGTDHLSFDSIGLPGFQFIQDPLEYDTRTHHSSMDVYERIQADDVKQASIIMASFVYQAAVRDEKLTRKPIDGEIVTGTEPAAAPAAAGAGAGQ